MLSANNIAWMGELATNIAGWTKGPLYRVGRLVGCRRRSTAG
jgi:hypothetical protein